MSKQDEATIIKELAARRMFHTRGPVPETRIKLTPSERTVLVEAFQRRSQLADDLAKLQAAVRSIREDYRADISFSIADEFDARLNKIEAELGDCISRARGETK